MPLKDQLAMPNNHTSFKVLSGDICFHWYESPVGKLLLTGNQTALATITFPIKNPVTVEHWLEDASPFTEVCRQLDHYFAGTLTDFDLPLAPTGTDFQRNVWSQLLQIPYGETTSYGNIARELRNDKAMRAVGSANGRNPIPIIIPCHRVIGSNGSLTGFGGGLPTKAYLLDLENLEQLCLPL